MTSETLTGEALCRRIDAIIAERSLLKHPFYQAWQRGELTLDALRGYACQYFHHVLLFPTYVSGAHANCDDLADRQELLENLIEEEQGENNHPELWLRFAESLGLDREEVTGSEPLPETTQLIDTFRRVTKEGPFIRSITALYCYESQVPEIAATKMAGLKEFYGIDDRRGLQFFIVHKSLDVEHSEVTRNQIAKYGKGQAAAAEEAAKATTDALWSFLDGVYREHVAA